MSSQNAILFVHDRSGTHRDEYLYSTDPALLPEAVVGYYTCRWNIETTFQECRSGLGLETTRGWCRSTVLRAAPCLFGLYAVVAVWFAALPEAKRSGSVAWPGKSGVTFSDALVAVRRWLWNKTVFRQFDANGQLTKIPRQLRNILLAALAAAP